MKEEEFLSLSETARLFNVSERTIHRWIHEGRIPVYKPGHAYRFRMSDLEEFLAAREVRPKVEAPSPELPLTGFEDERRVVTGSAHLEGSGTLKAAGERIMQVVKLHAAGELSYDAAEAKVAEILAEIEAAA